ncbi:MAG: energy-coupling factor transporter transmembrane protein EcfT [Propionibacteriales bacterium]|nr:energy-coupling factor transporter transmembrane protein EcfT [Propionibacteriales bacterium]
MIGLRRPGPLSVLAGCLVPVSGAFAIDSLQVGLLGLAAELGTLGWLVRDARGTLVRAALGFVAAAGIAVSTWLYAGRDVAEAGAAACRILYLVLPSALLLALLRPSELGDHLAQRLHLPARGVVACTAALQRLESFADDWRTVARARRARGLGPQGGPVRRVRTSGASAFALLVVSMRHTSAMAVAMDARGFATATRRTWAEPAPWQTADSLLMLVAAVLGVLPWLLH